MFGKLSWAAVPLDQPLPMAASALVAFAILGMLGWVAAKGHSPLLWREWITSVDHKRVGVMYTLLALVMLLRGFADALMMRAQQALALHSGGYLPPAHYDQVFSAHGTVMIFFVAMPFMIGLMNFVVPLQLGVRDVAFPTLNSVGFWLTATGALLVNISLGIGEFARTGWLPYPPLSELAYSPGVGVDYYCWALQISGIGTLLSGINLVTTILKVRAPGMTYLRMPMFCWTALASNLLIVAAFPILTATLAMLSLDRYGGFHFFTNEAGGNVMMFMNLIWAWGHPEVYILILPAFGIFSEVISTFAAKPLFGYRSMVLATMVICVLSFMVWLHHFFTMGAGADVNAVFGIATTVIAVPTGVKIFNWLFTMYGGRLRYATPLLWAVAFMTTFVVGGMTGVLLAVPPADFVLHNSLFLVAHFHNVIIGGVLFGAFAGYEYWFPKAFGFRLHEGWGRAAFGFWVTGFYVAFMPLYMLGLMGMTRRMQHYDVAAWRPGLLVAAAGAGLILTGIVCQIAQLSVSIRRRDVLREATGDPWNGRSLEWATASPPPAFNFARLPQVGGRDAHWRAKRAAGSHPEVAAMTRDAAAYRDAAVDEDIDLPRNSPTGVVSAFFATVMGFALIWHIWWMVGLGFAGAYATFVRFAWRDGPALSRPASLRVVVGFGFWIFLISDIVMFSAFFAAYAVLSGHTAGGPPGAQLFDLRNVAVETACLLLSSFACGVAGIGAGTRRTGLFQGAMAATAVLGAVFLALEVREFSGLIARGAGPGRNAFLSAFFALVGCHGLHVSAGLLWLLTMMAQVRAKGFRDDILRRVLCFSLFWHALDIVWVALFTVVYLMGTTP